MRSNWDLVRITSLIILSLGLLSGCSMREPAILLNQVPPSARVYMMDGTARTTSDLRGRKAVIVFWAEWCPHSRPFIEKLNRWIAANHPANTEFLAVSLDDFTRTEQLEDYLRSQKIDHLPIALSGNGIYDEAYLAYQATAIPDVFVLNEQGVIVAEGHGMDVVSDGLERADKRR